jgi:serralysin
MSAKIIKTRVEVPLPPQLAVEAAQRAIAENPANAPAAHFAPGVGALPPTPSFMAVLTGRPWRIGRTLRVRFLGGDPEVQRRLQPFAHQWSDFANIKFVFGDDPDAEIRVAFADDGSWSCIGTDALTVPVGQATMNYGWLTPGTDDTEYSRAVIHEFGHALGCIHEHSSPAAGILWNKEAVYRYYQGPPNNWNRADVDFNLFQRYSQSITQFTEFDRESIMLYPIPNDLTIGDFKVGWNTVLSPRDTEFIGTIYPQGEPPVIVLAVGGAPTAACHRPARGRGPLQVHCRDGRRLRDRDLGMDKRGSAALRPRRCGQSDRRGRQWRLSVECQDRRSARARHLHRHDPPPPADGDRELQHLRADGVVIGFSDGKPDSVGAGPRLYQSCGIINW